MCFSAADSRAHRKSDSNDSPGSLGNQVLGDQERSISHFSCETKRRLDKRESGRVTEAVCVCVFCMCWEIGGRLDPKNTLLYFVCRGGVENRTIDCSKKGRKKTKHSSTCAASSQGICLDVVPLKKRVKMAWTLIYSCWLFPLSSLARMLFAQAKRWGRLSANHRGKGFFF